MLDHGNTSNNMMAEYNSAQNSKSSPATSSKPAAQADTAKPKMSTGTVSDTYMGNQKSKNGNGFVSDYSSEKNSMADTSDNAKPKESNETVSDTSSGNQKNKNGSSAASESSEKNSKTDSAVSPEKSKNSGALSGSSDTAKPKMSNGTVSDTTSGSKKDPNDNSLFLDYFYGKDSMNDSSVSPAKQENDQTVSKAAETQNKTNSSVSPAKTGKKNGGQVSGDYVGGQGCTPNLSRFPAETPDAMAYVPFQQFNTTYPAERGLNYGTIFPELNKPFLGGGMTK